MIIALFTKQFLNPERVILLIYKVIMTSLRDLKAFDRHYYYNNAIPSGFFPTIFRGIF
jgi:hypothetical protein